MKNNENEQNEQEYTNKTNLTEIEEIKIDEQLILSNSEKLELLKKELQILTIKKMFFEGYMNNKKEQVITRVVFDTEELGKVTMKVLTYKNIEVETSLGTFIENKKIQGQKMGELDVLIFQISGKLKKGKPAKIQTMVSTFKKGETIYNTINYFDFKNSDIL